MGICEINNELRHYNIMLNNIEYWSKYGYIKENIVIVLKEYRTKKKQYYKNQLITKQ
jgi:hypothetical protein